LNKTVVSKVAYASRKFKIMPVEKTKILQIWKAVGVCWTISFKSGLRAVQFDLLWNLGGFQEPLNYGPVTSCPRDPHVHMNHVTSQCFVSTHTHLGLCWGIRLLESLEYHFTQTAQPYTQSVGHFSSLWGTMRANSRSLFRPSRRDSVAEGIVDTRRKRRLAHWTAAVPSTTSTWTHSTRHRLINRDEDNTGVIVGRGGSYKIWGGEGVAKWSIGRGTAPQTHVSQAFAICDANMDRLSSFKI